MFAHASNADGRESTSRALLMPDEGLSKECAICGNQNNRSELVAYLRALSSYSLTAESTECAYIPEFQSVLAVQSLIVATGISLVSLKQKS